MYLKTLKYQRYHSILKFHLCLMNLKFPMYHYFLKYLKYH
jgi:hypothetical protein